MRLVAFLTMVMTIHAVASDISLTTVPSVDLKRYMGKWYEIAGYPNRFQRKCTGYVTANYTLRPDGKVEVLNSCQENEGRINSAKGTAESCGRTDQCQAKGDILLAVLRQLLDYRFGTRLFVCGCWRAKTRLPMDSSRSPRMDEPAFTSKSWGRSKRPDMMLAKLVKASQLTP